MRFFCLFLKLETACKLKQRLKNPIFQVQFWSCSVPLYFLSGRPIHGSSLSNYRVDHGPTIQSTRKNSFIEKNTSDDTKIVAKKLIFREKNFESITFNNYNCHPYDFYRKYINEKVSHQIIK